MANLCEFNVYLRQDSDCGWVAEVSPVETHNALHTATSQRKADARKAAWKWIQGW